MRHKILIQGAFFTSDSQVIPTIKINILPFHTIEIFTPNTTPRELNALAEITSKSKA